jgi:two-component system NtrC family sensor kinase
MSEAKRPIEAIADLCGLFARDESEKANVAAVDILKRYFGAEEAALFYVNGRKEFRFCLAGTEFPIGLPEARWRESVGPVRSAPAVSRFGPWSLPGFGSPREFWISSELYTSEGNLSFVLLGRSSEPWSSEEMDALSAIARAITPIVDVRIEREREEYVRHQVETMLAENEKKLRAFFEDSRDMIYTANSDDVVTMVNAAGLLFTGRSEKYEVLGHPFSELVLNPEDRECFLRRIREADFVADYEIILKRSDGTTVFGLETAHVLRDAKGEIIETQGIIKDISERIRNERELWKANLELAEANLKLQQTHVIMVQQEKLASIGQLAAGIAHEINNPVGFLKSNSATIEKYIRSIREGWEEARRGAGPVIDEIERRLDLGYAFSQFDEVFAESTEGFARIMSIVGNLKKFSRIDATSGFELYDVNKGIESSLVVAWNEIKYVAEVRQRLGELPKIRARGGEINQVILNILVNAAQAIEAQKRSERGLIEIQTEARGDSISIRISDDGPGIPDSIRNKVFDPFFTTKDPGKGTGLGLSISYDIVVTKHRGKISLESGAGTGTTFIIELPIDGPPSPQ